MPSISELAVADELIKRNPGQSKVVKKYSYDGLPHYGAWSHLTGPMVLERVDALLAAGTLRSTGGRFPKLEVA